MKLGVGYKILTYIHFSIYHTQCTSMSCYSMSLVRMERNNKIKGCTVTSLDEFRQSSTKFQVRLYIFQILLHE